MEYEKKETFEEIGKIVESTAVVDDKGEFKVASNGSRHYMVRLFNGEHKLKFTGFQKKLDDGSFKEMPKVGDYGKILYNKTPNPQAKPEDEEYMKWYKNFYHFIEQTEPKEAEKQQELPINNTEIKDYIASYKKLCDEKSVKPTKSMAIGLFMANHRKEHVITKSIIDEFTKVM